MGAINKLTVREVASLISRKVDAPKIVSDGGGLYIRLRPNRAASWLFVSVRGKRRREMTLGPAPDLSLAKAREAASAARIALAEGRDPFAERTASNDEKIDGDSPDFGSYADALISELEASWSNPVHRRQWRHSFKVHALSLRPLPLAGVTTEQVLNVLKPLWAKHEETASRLRGRIERVLDAARAQGLITGPWENPARWRGHLSHLLPARRKLSARGHQAAMPFEQVPAFIRDLRTRQALAARALELTILCATRTNETLQATAQEFDLQRGIWTIPAVRTKLRREHRVPLTPRAIELLDSVLPDVASEFVFAIARGKALSNMSMLALLRRMGKGDLTVHGFRSSFRDWAGECTEHSEATAEAALAHSVGDATVRAYRRGDAFEKRRRLMEDWADYCGSRADRASVRDPMHVLR